MEQEGRIYERRRRVAEQRTGLFGMGTDLHRPDDYAAAVDRLVPHRVILEMYSCPKPKGEYRLALLVTVACS